MPCYAPLRIKNGVFFLFLRCFNKWNMCKEASVCTQTCSYNQACLCIEGKPVLMSAPVFTCPFLPVQTKMQPRRLWGCLWGIVRMRAVNIAKLGDFKMTTSGDVVWVIAANRNCCCQHAPKMRALTPLQRGEQVPWL